MGILETPEPRSRSRLTTLRAGRILILGQRVRLKSHWFVYGFFSIQEEEEMNTEQPGPISAWNVDTAQRSGASGERRQQGRRGSDLTQQLVQTAVDSLGYLGYGVLIMQMEESGRIVYVTNSARRILESCKGLIWLAEDRLLFASKEHERHVGTIAAAIRCGWSADAAECAGYAFRIERARPRQAVVVSFVPLPHCPPRNPPVAYAMIVLSDPDLQPEFRWRLLGRQFRLTPAEIRLCRALAEGLGVADYCSRHGVSLNTARTQLKSIYAKTDVRRGAELVRLILAFIRP